MAGENCVISIPRFGKAKVKATHVAHGVNLFTFGPSNDQMSRTRRQFFTSVTTSGSFELGLVFSSYKAYNDFMGWLQRYVQWIGNPNTEASPARVVIPGRKFDKTGVLESGITFGDRAGRFIYTVTLTFMGGRDPILNDKSGLVSSDVNPSGDQTLVRLYPSGSPMSGMYAWNTVGLVDDRDLGGGPPVHVR